MFHNKDSCKTILLNSVFAIVEIFSNSISLLTHKMNIALIRKGKNIVISYLNRQLTL